MENIINLKEIINNNYPVDVNDIEKNEESTDGNVYIMDNKYVMKIYDDISKAETMTKLHTFLKSKNINVPNIVLTTNNKEYFSLDNKYIVLYTFLNGKKIDKWFKDDVEVIKSIARIT